MEWNRKEFYDRHEVQTRNKKKPITKDMQNN